MRECWSYMDPKRQRAATSVDRMGRLVEKALNVFHIETTVNNRMFDRPLEFLHKNEDDWTGSERASFKALAFTLSKLPQAARQAVFQRVPIPYGVTGVFAGECEAVHAQTLEKCNAQYLVPVHGSGRHPGVGHPVHQPVQRQLVPQPAARAGDGAGVPLQPVPGGSRSSGRAAR